MKTWILSHSISVCFLPQPNFCACSPTRASFTIFAVLSMRSHPYCVEAAKVGVGLPVSPRARLPMGPPAKAPPVGAAVNPGFVQFRLAVNENSNSLFKQRTSSHRAKHARKTRLRLALL